MLPVKSASMLTKTPKSVSLGGTIVPAAAIPRVITECALALASMLMEAVVAGIAP